MAKTIVTTQLRLIADLVTQEFTEKKLGVVDQQVIQEKIVSQLLSTSHDYALSKIPVNFYNGIADRGILYFLVGVITEEYLAKINTSNYVPGSISKRLEARGMMFTTAVKTLSLVKTKIGINSAADVVQSLSLDPAMLAGTNISPNQDFMYLILADSDYRNKFLSRLKQVAIPHYQRLDVNALNEISGLISIGRGEAVPVEYFPIQMAMRSLVLMSLQHMFEASKLKQEMLTDILPALSLFILYCNITENEQVYDTAFPAISVAGANNIYMQRVTSTLKQLAMMFTKVGFVGKAFNGVVSTRLMKEFFNILPDYADMMTYVDPRSDANGNPIIDFSSKSFAEQHTAKYNEAVSIFDEVLPSMFKGYTEEVIQSFKLAANMDVLLTTVIDHITDDRDRPAFPNLTAGFQELLTILEDPEGRDSYPAKAMCEIRMSQFQTFILSRIFPGVDSIYYSAKQLKSAYERILSSIGTPTSGMIPGVNVELEVMNRTLVKEVPCIGDLNNISYTRLDQSYSWPFFIPALAMKKDKSQIWSLGHLKFKFLRPEKIFTHFALTGHIIGLDQSPDAPTIGTDLISSALRRWSWLKESIPTPTYMHDVGFSYTPLPFNYTYDTVFDYISNKGDKIEKMMNRTGKVPSIGYLTYGEILNGYISNGTVAPADIALSLAGLGFIYTRREDGSWGLVSPGCPTIYGMPTIMMIQQNFVAINKFIDPSLTRIGFKDLTDKTVERFIYDKKLKRVGTGDMIFVLHAKIPKPAPIRYFMADLRNGFSVKIPFFSDIYNALFRKSITTVVAQFDKDGADPLTGKKFDPNTMADVPYFDLQDIFGQMISLFMTIPELGSAKASEKSQITTAATFYKNYLTGTDGDDSGLKATFEEFCNDRFEVVLGWSNVIVAYPHLTMSNRFDEFADLHLSHLMRPLISKVHVDTQLMASRETVRILALAPNTIQQMDAEDEIFHAGFWYCQDLRNFHHGTNSFTNIIQAW